MRIWSDTRKIQRKSSKVKSLVFFLFFFYLFCCFLISIKLQIVLHSKALFYLTDSQSLSIPLWTVAPDYKTQIRLEENNTLVFSRLPRGRHGAAETRSRQGLSPVVLSILPGFVSSLYPECSAASTFTILPISPVFICVSEAAL